MPIYEFQHIGSARVVERRYPKDAIPDIGQEVDIDGHRYRRIISMPIGGGVVDRATPSYTAPNWAPGAERYGQDGTPYYKSDAQAKSSAVRMGYTYRNK